MDYIEAFKNLKTNNKYSRKSPHKAILLLTIIEMYETNVLTDNMILYDDTLKRTFLRVWERILMDEPIFHPEAYFPFWYMQNEDFWHIVPKRGQEDILTLLRDNHIKPSENKLLDCVNYAELDEDLYFLMTLPSGRSSLKRALLESYTNLNEEEIDRLSVSEDNSVDNSISALSDYEKILSNPKSETNAEVVNTNIELIQNFQKLNEDLQIALNLQYYSFLKSHRNERELFKEICPTVYDLLDKIVSHPIKQGEMSPSFAIIYDNFLSDLKISLMSEEGSMELIDQISYAVDILRGIIQEEKEEIIAEEEQIDIENVESQNDNPDIPDYSIDDLEIEHVYLDSHNNVIPPNTEPEIISKNDLSIEDRKGKPWTENEEELLTLYFKQGRDYSEIAEVLGRTEVAIKLRLAKLGLIEYTYGQEEDPSPRPVKEESDITIGCKESDFEIMNYDTICVILNKKFESVFSTEGKLKYINGKLYRLNLKYECFTVKGMHYDGTVWTKGKKKIVALRKKELYYKIFNSKDYCEIVEDIEDSPIFEECRIKVDGIWYCYNGSPVISIPEPSKEIKDIEVAESDEELPHFSVKVGDTLRLLPSQFVGEVINLRLDKKGNKKIVVKGRDEQTIEVYDNKYLYEKINNKNNKETSKRETKRDNHEVSSVRLKKSKVEIGNWIQWKPTGDVGKVIGFKTVGPVNKIVLRLKGGSELEVYDNPRAYEIIMR